MPKTGRTWLPLDVNYFDDDKVCAAGEKGAWLFLRFMARAKQLGRDGSLTQAQIAGLGIPGWKPRLAACIDAGLLVERDAMYVTPAWLAWNDPASKVAEQREADAERKRLVRSLSKRTETGHDRTVRNLSVRNPNVEVEVEREIDKPIGLGGQETSATGVTPLAPSRVRNVVEAWTNSRLQNGMTKPTERTRNLVTNAAAGLLREDVPLGELLAAAIELGKTSYDDLRRQVDLGRTPAKRTGARQEPGDFTNFTNGQAMTGAEYLNR